MVADLEILARDIKQARVFLVTQMLQISRAIAIRGVTREQAHDV